jgi:hypothetical protein
VAQKFLKKSRCLYSVLRLHEGQSQIHTILNGRSQFNVEYVSPSLVLVRECSTKSVYFLQATTTSLIQVALASRAMLLEEIVNRFATLVPVDVEGTVAVTLGRELRR